MHAEREPRVRPDAGHDVRRIRVGFQRTLHALAPLQRDEGRGSDLRLPQCSLRLGGADDDDLQRGEARLALFRRVGLLLLLGHGVRRAASAPAPAFLAVLRWAWPRSVRC